MWLSPLKKTVSRQRQWKGRDDSGKVGKRVGRSGKDLEGRGGCDKLDEKSATLPGKR